ncbi:MAG: vitamin K epoxide reductase family protein [Pirellulales bacterium]
MLWPTRLLSLAALAIAGYLFWAHTTGTPIAGCDPTSGLGCGEALSSRWSVWFGIPVLWIGAACYAVIFVASWGLARHGEGVSAFAWRTFVAAVVLAAGAGLWFLGLQLVGESSLCPYCIAIHACGLMIATLVGVYLLANRMAEQRQPGAANLVGLRSTLGSRTTPIASIQSPLALPSLALSYVISILALSALVSGQVLFAPPQYLVADGQLDQPVDLDAPSTKATPERNVDSATDSAPSAADATPPVVEGDAVDDENRHEVLKVDPSVNSAASKESAAAEALAKITSGRRKTGNRTVELLKGKLKIDTYEHPVLGNPDAEHVIVEFFDYKCPHCRLMHKFVAESLPKYGEQLAIVMLPVPNDILCNRYVRQGGEDHRGACKLANLAIATADLDPLTFVRLHDWIMDQEHPPSYSSSLRRASQTIDQSKLIGQLARADVPERVQRYIELFATMSRTVKSSLPMQIVGDEVISGAPASAQELSDLWEQKLGIKPVQ